MRFIDTTGLVLPPGWEERAKEARAAVAALEPGQRAEAINVRQAIWSDLKAALRRLSHNKCWYCESVDRRSDNTVDHFRPKNSVKGSARFPLRATHSGYWWLAFDYHNYRFCCTYCNSIRKSAAGICGGKQDCFPLWDDGHRARSADDDQDRELPLLLDPTNSADIGALWFDESGLAVPRPQRPGEPDAGYRCWTARAQESIATYHLNHPDTLEARPELANQVRHLAEDADKWLRRMSKAQEDAERWLDWLNQSDPGAPAERAEARAKVGAAHAEFAVARAAVANNLALLRRVRGPDREYSGAAHCVLRGMRRSSLAVEILLDEHP